MTRNPRLSRSMTWAAFDNGYWYALELKAFAKELGVPSAGKLRKDELETAIKHFLRTGKVRAPTKRNLAIKGTKDVERGLHLDLPVVVYTNDPETKDFLEREARKLVPGLERKSGARYRLNRWRDDQLTAGVPITYRDLVAEYARLCQVDGRFEQIPHVRYINFLSDFLRHEKGATKEQAIEAWNALKKLDAPKTYRGWVRARRG